jgi:hypothetical protein
LIWLWSPEILTLPLYPGDPESHARLQPQKDGDRYRFLKIGEDETSNVDAEDVTATVALAYVLPVDLVIELVFECRVEIPRRRTVLLMGDELDVGAFSGGLNGLDGFFYDSVPVGSVFWPFEVCRPRAVVDTIRDWFGAFVVVIVGGVRHR